MQQLAERFKKIVAKYGLDKKAESVAGYVTRHDLKGFSLEDFCKEFGMDKQDAEDFLHFIYKGIEFREKHLVKDGPRKEEKA